jgi:hypothetical protein
MQTEISMAEPKAELTTLDICKMYDVTRTSVYNWRKKGLPYYKLGGNGLSDPTRYALDKVTAFVKELTGRDVVNPIY